jgi:S1-C subfamily serine protease
MTNNGTITGGTGGFGGTGGTGGDGIFRNDSGGIGGTASRQLLPVALILEIPQATPPHGCVAGPTAVEAVVVRARIADAPVQALQKVIDAAVLRTLETATLPSPAAKAWEIIRPSVVRVRRIGPPKEGKDGQSGSEGEDIGVGSGVVIVESGLILTNLHVVEGATSIKVVFADGLVSDAEIVKTQPDQDLAILKARTLPDDLQAATMKSTADLRPGDTVIAAGFPFGIGPSVTSGVISGLKREFRTPQGQQLLTNLMRTLIFQKKLCLAEMPYKILKLKTEG